MKKRATCTDNKGLGQRFFIPVSDQKGFSLVELFVVVAVLGIIGTFGTPKFLSMKAKSSVRADARNVYSVFKHTQMEAVKRSESVCILFNIPNAGDYTVFLDNGGTTGTPDDALQNGDEANLFVKHLSPGNSFANVGFGGNPGFNLRGLPLDGNVGSVEIRSATTVLALRLSLSNAGYVKSTVL